MLHPDVYWTAKRSRRVMLAVVIPGLTSMAGLWALDNGISPFVVMPFILAGALISLLIAIKVLRAR